MGLTGLKSSWDVFLSGGSLGDLFLCIFHPQRPPTFLGVWPLPLFSKWVEPFLYHISMTILLSSHLFLTSALKGFLLLRTYMIRRAHSSTTQYSPHLKVLNFNDMCQVPFSM